MRIGQNTLAGDNESRSAGTLNDWLLPGTLVGVDQGRRINLNNCGPGNLEIIRQKRGKEETGKNGQLTHGAGFAHDAPCKAAFDLLQTGLEVGPQRLDNSFG